MGDNIKKILTIVLSFISITHVLYVLIVYMNVFKVNDVDGFIVCIILIYSHNGQPIYIGQVTLIRV